LRRQADGAKLGPGRRPRSAAPPGLAAHKEAFFHAQIQSINKWGATVNLKTTLLSLLIVSGSSLAYADLEPYKDYSVSDAVWSVTTIKVHSNMDDAYLEGLKKTWVESNEVARKLGQIEEYHIYRSDLPESGSFNMLLVIKFKNNESLAPNKARYEAFMKEWGAERNKKMTDTAQHDYPGMRDITGEYNVREITLTK
jgi:hypothetical protein